MSVLVSDLCACLCSSVERDYLGREVHALPCGVEDFATVGPIDEERSSEVVPKLFVRFAGHISFKVSEIDCLQAFREGVEPNVPRVLVPRWGSDIVFESGAEFADIPHFHSVHICKHKPLFVSLIPIAFHRNPANHPAIGAPNGCGVISSSHRNMNAFTALYIIYVYFRVRRECVVFSVLLPA